jgi:protein tyrosine/serine phosphatase
MPKMGQSKRRSAVRFLLIAVAAIGSYAAYTYRTNNFHTVIASQLYRSGQPTAEQIAEWHHRYGIKTIINLRGRYPSKDWYQIERAVAQGFGINMIDYRLSSKRELAADQVEELLAILAKAKPPILIHCSGGSDRSGLVSALYVAGVAHGSEAYAELQLTPFFGHFPLWFRPSFAMDRSFEKAEPRLGFPNS